MNYPLCLRVQLVQEHKYWKNMDKDLTKISERAASKELDREKEEYPVQQIPVETPITEVEVDNAVKEMNPDKSMY